VKPVELDVAVAVAVGYEYDELSEPRTIEADHVGVGDAALA